MFEAEYSISPAVKEDGTPSWNLWVIYPNPFIVSTPQKLASNTDKSILEKAIEHLKQNAA